MTNVSERSDTLHRQGHKQHAQTHCTEDLSWSDAPNHWFTQKCACILWWQNEPTKNEHKMKCNAGDRTVWSLRIVVGAEVWTTVTTANEHIQTQVIQTCMRIWEVQLVHVQTKMTIFCLITYLLQGSNTKPQLLFFLSFFLFYPKLFEREQRTLTAWFPCKSKL